MPDPPPLQIWHVALVFLTVPLCLSSSFFFCSRLRQDFHANYHVLEPETLTAVVPFHLPDVGVSPARFARVLSDFKPCTIVFYDPNLTCAREVCVCVCCLCVSVCVCVCVGTHLNAHMQAPSSRCSREAPVVLCR